jgi:hypothetical protein
LLFLLLSLRCSSLAVLACSFISVLLRHPQQKCSSQKCSSPEDKSFLRHGRHAVFLSLSSAVHASFVALFLCRSSGSV